MKLIYTLDLIGTFVFALSGVMTAAKKQFDVFGAAVIAFVTAVGGGTLRDVLIGSHPVGWMKDPLYFYLILTAVVVGFFFKQHIIKLSKTLFLFDTIGIGIFTILGLQKSLDHEIIPVIAVLMGTISAVFGGVIRDVLTNEVPLIFRKEIYATACFTGGLVYLALAQQFTENEFNVLLTVLLIISIRLLAVWKKWSLPRMK